MRSKETIEIVNCHAEGEVVYRELDSEAFQSCDHRHLCVESRECPPLADSRLSRQRFSGQLTDCFMRKSCLMEFGCHETLSIVLFPPRSSQPGDRLSTGRKRTIDRVLIWGRREQAARKVVENFPVASFSIEPVTDLEAAVREADIISCATLSIEPIIKGEWLRDGQHLDLVGAFRQDMCEADGEAVSRTEVFVDTYGGALSEAGDILQAIEEGAMKEADIVGDLSELARGKCQGRSSGEAITLFKSVGSALEDLAAAELVMWNQHA